MKSRITRSSIAALLILFFSHLSMAQDYQYHKVYIYNFTKYIHWPAEKQSGDFVIGVLGKSSIVKELEAMAANRTVGTQKIIIKQIESASDAASCHVVFVPSNKSNSFSDLKSQLDGKPTLLITERNGLAKEGSGINFVLVGGKLKYELNKNSIDKSGLKVAPDLVKLAILVNG